MSSASPTRGVDLKTSLMLRIALVALGCLALVAAITLVETRREDRARAATTAEIIGKHLELQLLRIDTGIDAAKRFPDWDAVLPNLPLSGQCVLLRDTRGAVVRSHCTGTAPLQDAPPAWFAAAWKQVLPSEDSVDRPISYKGTSFGSVVVSSASDAVMARTWRQMKQLLILTGLTILAVSVLVYVAVANALAPTGDMIAGLDKLKAGEFSTRLPAFRLKELQRISEVSNALAEKIETTLAERRHRSRLARCKEILASVSVSLSSSRTAVRALQRRAGAAQ
jgi:two-component system, NarL family, sensor histidine kinase UhpB